MRMFNGCDLANYGTSFDSLSLSAYFLELKGTGDTPRHATGFFWRHSGRIFLITNWHVVAGINIFDGKPMSYGWCPEKITIHYFTNPAPTRDAAATSIGPDAVSISCPTLDVCVYHDFHTPFWIQHPDTFELNIDIVAMEVTDKILHSESIRCVNEYEYSNLLHFAGTDIFVLGHPITKANNRYPAMFPIWKRGSIASELIVPWNMRPAFLIDCRTSKGMSGSPAFCRAFGPANQSDLTIRYDNIKVSEFMGVYSGRIYDDEGIASLGLVWYRSLIDQIISFGVQGSRDWRPSKSAPDIFRAAIQL